MNNHIYVNFDVNDFSIEMQIADFVHFIDAALSHEDEFFLEILRKLDNIIEKNNEKITHA